MEEQDYILKDQTIKILGSLISSTYNIEVIKVVGIPCSLQILLKLFVVKCPVKNL